jgi:hypothetical protein
MASKDEAAAKKGQVQALGGLCIGCAGYSVSAPPLDCACVIEI